MSRRRFRWLWTPALLLWFAATCSVWIVSNQLLHTEPPSYSWPWFLAAILMAVPLILLASRGLSRLFGPLFRYDLVRTARHNRHIPPRCLYGGLLLGTVFLFYSSQFPSRTDSVDALFQPGQMRLSEASNFANRFFWTFLGAQLAVVVLLTPAYTAGAIAEEKERRTLEFLLVTELSNREIVFGSLASRMGNLVLLILTGLPVLSLMQFLGGVDPNLVLAGFAATLLTMFSLGGVCMLVSVYARRALGAFVGSYLIAVVYFIITAIILFAADPLGSAWLLWAYAVCQGLVGLLFATAAASELRTVAREEQGTPALAPPPRVAGPKVLAPVRNRADSVYEEPVLHGPRPDVSDPPMLWKECYVQQRLNTLPAGLVLLCAAFFLMLGSAAASQTKEQGIRPWGAALTCFVFLIGPFSAAGSISREREKQTLETLLVTPIERDDILYAKWLASLLVARWIWLAMALVWGVAAAFGGIHLLALPLLLTAWFVYATFLAWLGVWFSSVCATTLRATLLTVLTTLALVAVPWALSVGTEAELKVHTDAGGTDWVVRFVVNGLAPPRTLSVLAFSPDELADASSEALRLNIQAALAGVLCYAAGAVVLWQLTRFRFHRQTGARPRWTPATETGKT
jgi:ABC-type transport system involved in multi-copper enzyme maturation permease subunit